MSPNSPPARFGRILGLATSLLLLSCDLTDEKGGPAGPPVDTTGANPSVADKFPPHPPSDVLALAGDARATVSWTAPGYAGSSAITGYRAHAVEDTSRQCAAGAALGACTITGLRNKATYTFVVRALNKHGGSDPSLPSLTVVPLPPLLPAPLGLVAVAGRGTATLSWSAPPPGTWVSVHSPQDLARKCGSDSASSCVVTGLEFGKTYTFVARAHSDVGAGAFSEPTGPVTSLPTLPGAPFSASAVAGDTQATVAWTPPASNGGDSILGYEVSALNSTGISCATGPQGRSCVVGNLPVNASVSFRVRAVNAFGAGPSKTTGSVWPYFVQKAPGRPSISKVAPGNGQVTVTWMAPSAGASPITGYRVYAANTAARCTTSTLSCTVTGLTNGTTYTFSVEAENSFGAGLRSYGATATPTALPSEPTSFAAAPGDGQVTLSWQPPVSAGAGPVTGYRATIGQLLAGCTTSGLSCTVTGLTNGTFYLFEVHAVNDSGEGAPASVSATPGAPPGPPLNVAGVAGNGRATVSWSPPASDGGRAITGYTAKAVEDAARSCSVTGSGRSCLILGLANGTPYTFVVSAVNDRGTGPASAPTSPVTPLP
jgi:titin